MPQVQGESISFVGRLIRMQRPNSTTRLVVTILAIPFLIGGLLLSAALHSALSEYLNPPVLSWLVFLVLAFAGVVFGGLVAHGILTFLIACLSPNSPLIAESEISNPTLSERILSPPLRLIGKVARSLATKQRRP